MIRARFNIRCHPADKEMWMQVGGRNVSAWAGEVLTQAARYEKVTGKNAAHYLHEAARRAEWHRGKSRISS